MNKRKTIILETLKDLQMDKANKLFDDMIASGSFVERQEIDHTVMFLFPDGRLLGSRDFDKNKTVKLSEKVSAYLGVRPAYHSELTHHLPEEMKKKAHKDKWGIHPLSNDRVGKYYNIIIVAQGHISNQVLVPYLVEPTEAQKKRLEEFKSLGFNVEYAKQSYAGANYSPIEEALSAILETYSRNSMIRQYGNKILLAAIKDSGFIGSVLPYDDNLDLYKQIEDYLKGEGRNIKDQREKLDIYHQKIIHEFMSESQRRKVLDEVLGKFESIDPSPNKIYVPFLIKNYTGNRTAHSIMEDITSVISDNLDKYHYIKQRNLFEVDDEVYRDIFRFKDFRDFYLTMVNYPNKEEYERDTNKDDYTTVFEDYKVTIYVPHSKAASCHLGSNTSWCTASRGAYNYFDTYSRSGNLYIFVPKNPIRVGEKYQVHFEKNEFKDEFNEDVSIIYLLKERFGDISPLFEEKYSEFLRFSVFFLSDEELETIIDKIKSAIMSHVDEWLDYCSRIDYPYQEYLDELALKEDPDAIQYLEFYTELDRDYDALKKALSLSPKDLIGIVNYYMEDGYADDELYKINNLDKIYTKYLKDELKRTWGEEIKDEVLDYLRDGGIIVEVGTNHDSNIYVHKKHFGSRSFELV